MANIHQISVSDGGVPKHAVPRAKVTVNGVEGDRQNDLKHHGGPTRAVCLLGLDVIRRLRDEGHPIQPGAVGENLTIDGLDWSTLQPGQRIRFNGGVELEITSFTEPCATIRDAFTELNFRRIKQKLHPGDSRLYARVITEGEVAAGEELEVI